MKLKTLTPLILIGLLCGCAGGPVHDHYNPAVVGATFTGPVTVDLVTDINTARDQCIRDGYTVIGTCAYGGKYPKTSEIIAQAKRVHANHVIYGGNHVDAKPGSWGFSFGNGFGSGGSGNGHDDMVIIFLGR